MRIASGIPGQELARRAPGFVNLGSGDAYLEAAIGRQAPGNSDRVVERIDVAIRFALS